MTPRQRHLLGLAATLAAGLAAVWAASTHDAPGEHSDPPPAVTDPAVPLRAHVGDTIAVVLRSNPTTGYAWQLRPGSEPVAEPAGHSYVADRPVREGSGGRDVWRFRAVVPGRADVRFDLVPPSGPAPTDSAHFTLLVD